jgi:SAM-dependent methyltransferase
MDVDSRSGVCGAGLDSAGQGRYLWRSLPLLRLLAVIGLEMAGRAGSWLAGALGIAVHPVTLQEIRRVLKPGGRAALTCWEPLDRNNERLSPRIRRANLGAGLRQAGFPTGRPMRG